ncbi:MAG: carboxypeptidase-like regulatory domain-containing protein [Chitinophagaceae bacterium]
MKIFLLNIACLLLTFNVTFAQSTGRISGTINDSVSGEFMESATVIIYKPDSSVITFKISDTKGRFEITGIPMKGSYYLVASYAGYKDYRLSFKMDSLVKKFDDIFLGVKSNEEVIITSIIPIRMNGDTLEINPAAFKMTEDAVGEDLLNKVPGIVIWADGSITMDGKSISKLLVNGKPFLGSRDPRIATQNLPKNIIEKIQVYSEMDLTSLQNQAGIQNQDEPKDSSLTMNIRLKANKNKGMFGKYGAGIGTDTRYQVDGAVNMFNKNSSMALGIGSNNTNTSIANLNEIMQESTFRNNYSTYRNRSNFNRSGINRVISPGIQFTHSFIETENDRRRNRIIGGYDFNGNMNKTTRQSYQERFLRGGDQIINAESENINSSESHDTKVNYIKSNRDNRELNINANSSFTNGKSESDNITVIRNRQNDLISDKKSSSSGNNNGRSFSTDLRFNNSNYDKPLVNYNLNTSFLYNENASTGKESSDYNFYSLSGINKTTINRISDKNSKTTNFNGNFNYNSLKRLLMGRFRFFGIRLQNDHNFSYRKTEEANNVYDVENNGKINPNNYLTFSEEMVTTEYQPSLRVSKFINKFTSQKSWNININARGFSQLINEKNTSSKAYRNISRSFAFKRYDLGLTYNKRVNNVYNLSGNMGFRNNYGFPSIGQIAPVVDSMNLYNIYKGGLRLTTNETRSVSTGWQFNINNKKKDFELTATSNYNYNTIFRPYIDSTINLRDTININGFDSVYLNGKQIRYTIHGDKRYNSTIDWNTSMSKKFKNGQLQFQYNGSISKNRYPSYFDNIYSTINSVNTSHRTNMTYYYKTVLILGISGNLNNNNSKQTGYKNSNFHTRTVSGELSVTVNFTQNTKLSSQISYSKNNGLIKPITIWNSNATFRFLKSKQAELKFSATDILKQFKNISYNANADGVSSTVTNGLQQYFMVTVSYFPRKFGGKSGGNPEGRNSPGERRGSDRNIIRQMR